MCLGRSSALQSHVPIYLSHVACPPGPGVVMGLGIVVWLLHGSHDISGGHCKYDCITGTFTAGVLVLDWQSGLSPPIAE